MKNKELELETALKGISKSIKELIDKDMLDLGVSAYKINDGVVEYIDPLEPKNFHLFPNLYGKEIWKKVPDYQYMVSNLGRVKRKKGRVNNGSYFRTIKERVLKQYIEDSGYACVRLSKHGKQKSFRTHVLVGNIFLGYVSDITKHVVDHINGIKNDNRLDNLQIISNRENCSKDKKGYSSKYIGVYWHKFSKSWYAYIRINGVKKFLGSFNNEIDAHNAYQNKLKEITNVQHKNL